MVLSRKKRGSSAPVGLDIDGRYLAAVRMDGDHVSLLASEELEPGLVTDGEVRDAEGLAVALKSFFAAHDLSSSVLLGIANRQIAVRQIELPWLDDEKQRDTAVRFQAADAIAIPLDEAVMDYRVARRLEAIDGSERMQVVVVAARRSMLECFVQATRGAGLKAEGIDLNAFALIRALGPDEDDQEARVFCDIGTVVNLAIAVGDQCVFTRPLSGSSSERDQEGFASSLADELRRSVDSYRSQADAVPAREVVLSGPGSVSQELVAELTSLMRLPVTVAPALESIEGSALPSGDDPHRYTVATGLALGAAA